MPHMYILECCDGSYYTGSTIDLERRFYQHQNGEGANHTKKRLPVKLVYYEFFERVDNAFHREKQVQGWSRAKKQALIEKAYEKLPDLAWTRKGPKPPWEMLASTSSASGDTLSEPSSTKPLPLAEPVEANLPECAEVLANIRGLL